MPKCYGCVTLCRANKYIIAYVFFVISSEREDLLAEFENFSDFLNCEAKERIRIVTWKDLVRKASEIGINTRNFEDRYILL